MSASLLTVDQGNSATKFRAWRIDSQGALAAVDRVDIAAEFSNKADVEKIIVDLRVSVEDLLHHAGLK